MRLVYQTHALQLPVACASITKRMRLNYSRIIWNINRINTFIVTEFIIYLTYNNGRRNFVFFRNTSYPKETQAYGIGKYDKFRTTVVDFVSSW